MIITFSLATRESLVNIVITPRHILRYEKPLRSNKNTPKLTKMSRTTECCVSTIVSTEACNAYAAVQYKFSTRLLQIWRSDWLSY